LEKKNINNYYNSVIILPEVDMIPQVIQQLSADRI